LKWQIRKCVKCGQYTLKEICQKCNVETVNPHPAKFSLQDRYARYRVQKKVGANENDHKGEQG